MKQRTLEELIKIIENDFKAYFDKAIILRRSVLGVLSRVLAGAVYILQGFTSYIYKQIFPETADKENVIRHASLYGLKLKDATFANTKIAEDFPIGTILKRDDGVSYEVTSLNKIECIKAGIKGNTDKNIILKLVSPIVGFPLEITVKDGITGGTDQEDIEDLRNRLIEKRQAILTGGNDTDFIVWSKEVPGITRAWVFPMEQGKGTVTIRAVMDNKEGSIIPTEEELKPLQEHLDSKTIFAEIFVTAPVLKMIDIRIGNLSLNTSLVKENIKKSLINLFLKTYPGQLIKISHIKEAISTSEGEDDHRLVFPTENISSEFYEIPMLGEITWE